MNLNRLRIYLLVVCLLSNLVVCAQGDSPKLAYWLMPGINYAFSDKVNVVFQPCWNPQQDLKILFGQGNIRVSKYLMLNTGYMYIELSESSRVVQRQSTLLNGFTFSFPAYGFMIENRTLIWNRFIRNANDRHQIRDRLRLAMPIDVDNNVLKIFVFDEVTFDIKDLVWARNRLGIGASITCWNWLTMEGAYGRQVETHGRIHLIFLSIIGVIPHS